MKTIALLSIIALSLGIASCGTNEDMLTEINPDGSCSRSFTREVDSAFMIGDTAKSNPFPVDIDASWKISWSDSNTAVHTGWPLKTWEGNDKDKNKNTNATAWRKYNSVAEMAEHFRLKKSDDWSAIKPRYEFNKKFRWFYTYYTYKEIYPKLKTFDKVPFEKFMTSEEAEFWFSGRPDLLKGMNGVEIREYIGKLENKYNHWFTNNLWIVEYDELLKNYNLLNDKTISRTRLEQARDSVFNKYAPMADSNGPEMDMEASLNKYFNTNVFSQLWEKPDGAMKKFEDNSYNLEFLKYFGRSFSYELLMPGKIIQPDNAILHGDTLIWKLDAYRMVHNDYEIVAQSRKTNTWAFVLSILVGAIAVFSYIYKFKK
jgi:hypothetical protein